MCASCGCRLPEETHGNRDHITYGDLLRAAAAAGISPRMAVRNMKQAVRDAKKPPVDTATRVLREGPPQA